MSCYGRLHIYNADELFDNGIKKHHLESIVKCSAQSAKMGHHRVFICIFLDVDAIVKEAEKGAEKCYKCKNNDETSDEKTQELMESMEFEHPLLSSALIFETTLTPCVNYDAMLRCASSLSGTGR